MRISEIKRSREKFGEIYPCIVDQHGNLIDGLHRKKVDPNWKETRVNIKNEKEREEIALIVNVQRRNIKGEEITARLGRIAEVMKREGLKEGEFANEISKDMGMSERWVHKYIPEKYKRGGGYEPHAVRLPEGQFNVILADPPWQYQFSETYSRSIPAHYPDMDLKAICDLKRKLPIAKNAILFLWATSPKLEEAFEVIESWGFEYKTSLVWVKDKIGMGYYCRGQHELLLIATKGDFPIPLPKNRFASVINAPRTKHSEKPKVVYEMVEKMYPNKKYLELFARNKRKNWEGWGLEYENNTK